MVDASGASSVLSREAATKADGQSRCGARPAGAGDAGHCRGPDSTNAGRTGTARGHGGVNTTVPAPGRAPVFRDAGATVCGGGRGTRAFGRLHRIHAAEMHREIAPAS